MSTTVWSGAMKKTVKTVDENSGIAFHPAEAGCE
jgi:hypothetical protein